MCGAALLVVLKSCSNGDDANDAPVASEREVEDKPAEERALDAPSVPAHSNAELAGSAFATPPASSAVLVGDPADVPDGGDLERGAALVRQAQLYFKAEQWQRGIATLEEAIRVGPYDENLHYNLGSWMEARATPDSMIRYWSEELKRDPKPQTAYYYWAAGLERSGDEAGALGKLAQALQVDPAHELSELRCGQILARQRKTKEALSHCLAAIDIFPEFAAAHELCANLYKELGRTKDAERETTLAATSNSHSPRRFFYWGRYLAKKGRNEAAAAELRRALEQNPNDTEARALLGRLTPLLAKR